MTTEAERALSGERLREGQVIYTPIQRYGSTDLRSFDLTSLGLSKATFETQQKDGKAVVYHWRNPDEKPDISDSSIVGHALSPRFLFTTEEVAEILDIEQGQGIDWLFSDQDVSRNVAYQLLGAALRRFGDDLERYSVELA